MEKLDIKHTCPGCDHTFDNDYDFAAHIIYFHKEDFYNELQWIRKLPYSIYKLVKAQITGD